MEFYLFYDRPQRLISDAKMIPNGIFSIYTAFNPESLICFDGLFLTIHATDSSPAVIQCTLLEETPRILDIELDETTLQTFDELIANEDYLPATLSEKISNIVKSSAMDFGSQLVTN
ncbi:MAG: hypothetical protein ACKUBY_00655 [Candidatus Moraniibacteriota bacterium]|jgi:hypothetical protein